ncbi:hypothetical protein IV01_21545 [Pseudomonas syringae]|uniref:Uncharacterized protein n=1 Tax=Pseudomonas syringae TaxID=317 RepID=A0A085VC94_PSESX|nr:hypothetical protein IV01_21545 [Pseudomonas syringae]
MKKARSIAVLIAPEVRMRQRTSVGNGQDLEGSILRTDLFIAGVFFLSHPAGMLELARRELSIDADGH